MLLFHQMRHKEYLCIHYVLEALNKIHSETALTFTESNKKFYFSSVSILLSWKEKKND
jgi:hypothetical protein